MLGTLRLGWRRALASITMVSMFTVTLGITQLSVQAQSSSDNQKDAAEALRTAFDPVLLPDKLDSAQPDVVFSNTSPITIPAGPGNGNPYPSTIAVTGVTGQISNLTVTLSGFTHTWPDDVAVLLVGPTGVKVRLISDVGGPNDITGVNLTLSDAAANNVPDNPTVPITTGTYKPTTGTAPAGQGNPAPANFPAPAPASPYATTLASFNNTDPNGTWSLYVLDDSGGDSGSFSGGWSIDVTTSAPPVAAKPCFDFFGSGRTSFATFNAPTGGNILWKLRNNGGAGSQDVSFGLTASDFLTPGYFDTDNIADINVWRIGTTANSAAFYYLRPSTSPTSILGIQWGRNDGTTALTNDLPGREADYDGDGRDDPTVVRRVSGVWNWFYLRSSNNTLAVVQFGVGNGTATEDIPITGADYAGDNRADLVVLRINPSGPETYIVGDSNSSAFLLAQQWGEFDTDFYIIGDYVGDSKADFAVWRGFGTGTNGGWYIRENGGTGQQTSLLFGIPGAAGTRDVAVCGDYNGDGKSDIAVYRRSNSSFYWLNSPANTALGTQAVSGGTPTDSPVGLLRTF